MQIMTLGSLFGALALVACGSRTSLDDLPATSTDASSGSRSTGRSSTTSTSGSGSSSESGGVACEEGLNADMTPPIGCTSEETIWLATPYSPAMDINVESVKVLAGSMQLAVLTSVNSAPGSVVFTTSFEKSGEPAWETASVSPSVLLHAGQPYFIAFLNSGGFWTCAENGPDVVEFAAPSLTGPWMIDGTDAYVVRFSGTCP